MDGGVCLTGRGAGESRTLSPLSPVFTSQISDHRGTSPGNGEVKNKPTCESCEELPSRCLCSGLDVVITGQLLALRSNQGAPRDVGSQASTPKGGWGRCGLPWGSARQAGPEGRSLHPPGEPQLTLSRGQKKGMLDRRRERVPGPGHMAKEGRGRRQSPRVTAGRPRMPGPPWPSQAIWPLADPTSWTASRAAEEEEGAGGTWMGSSGQSPVLPRGLGQLEPRPRGQRPRTVCNSRVVHSSDLKQAEAQNQTRCLCTWVCMSACAWGCVHVWRGGENACA